MPKQQFEALIDELKEKYLPESEIELIEDSLKVQDGDNLWPISDNTLRIVTDRGEETVITFKITPQLFLKISADNSLYNLGILKNFSDRIAEELREHAITTT